MRKGVNITEAELFTVNSGYHERRDFENLLEDAPDIINLGDDGARIVPNFREFQHDGFNHFYKGVPVVKGADQVADSVSAHTQILAEMNGLEELKNLRTKTVRNKIASLVATQTLNDVVENLPDELKQSIHKQQSAQKTAEDLENRLEVLRDMWRRAEPGEQKEQIEEAGKDGAEVLETAQGDAQQAKEEMDAQFGNDPSAVRVALRDALNEANEKIGAVKEALGAFGSGCGSSPGFPVQIPEVDAAKLAQKVQYDPQLQKIARLAGRFQRISAQAKEGREKGPFGEIVDIETGNDIMRLTSGELTALAHPDLKMNLFKKLADHSATLWLKEDEDPQGLGPIILVQDGSGSTGGQSGVFEWESAIGLTLRQEAAKRGKPFIWIHFSTNTIVKRFEGDGQELECAEWAQTYMGGGTNPKEALEKVIEVFETEHDMKKADFVFMSDGQFSVDATEFRTKLAQFGAKSLGIFMQGSGRADPVEVFGPLVDKCWAFNPRNNESEIPILTELFRDHI